MGERCYKKPLESSITNRNNDIKKKKKLSLEKAETKKMGFENPLLKYSYETRGWITLASGVALHFVLGNFYLWGSITTYTTSYLNQEGHDVTKDDAGLVFPFTFFAINVGLPFGVGLATYFGWKKYIFVASILMGMAVVISSFVVGTFALFILFYGIFFGLLVGFLYMVPFNSCYL